MYKTGLLIATLLLCSVAGAQKTQSVIGVYSSGGSSAAFLPDNKFVAVGMGTIVVGTWEEEGESVVVRLIDPMPENFYLFAIHNPKIDQVRIQFDDFSDGEGAYSFDDSAVMHPVYDKGPYSISYPLTIDIPKGKHSQIRLISLNRESGYDGKDEYLPLDTITNNLYTFDLDPQFNDFKIVSREIPDFRRTLPMVFELRNGVLLHDGVKQGERRPLKSLREEDQIFISEIANSIGVPVTSRDFSDEDEAGNWIPVSYPIIYHKLKELRQVQFDNRNLFRGHDPDSYEN